MYCGAAWSKKSSGTHALIQQDREKFCTKEMASRHLFSFIFCLLPAELPSFLKMTFNIKSNYIVNNHMTIACCQFLMEWFHYNYLFCPCNPYLKTDGTCLLINFFVRDENKDSNKIMMEWFHQKIYVSDVDNRSSGFCFLSIYFLAMQ